MTSVGKCVGATTTRPLGAWQRESTSAELIALVLPMNAQMSEMFERPHLRLCIPPLGPADPRLSAVQRPPPPPPPGPRGCY